MELKDPVRLPKNGDKQVNEHDVGDKQINDQKDHNHPVAVLNSARF